MPHFVRCLIKVVGGAPGETKCQTDRTIDRGLGLGDKIGNLHLAANIQTAFQRRVGLAHCRVRYGAESKYNSDILYLTPHFVMGSSRNPMPLGLSYANLFRCSILTQEQAIGWLRWLRNPTGAG